jgi:hypothetical protein
MASLASLEIVNKDSTICLDGARPPPISLIVLPLPEAVFLAVCDPSVDKL